mmetsp:Transcript_77218/g.179087  ORF Transcript_77218/g.179087 Transcript_77218/m.179087 type:complete len:451 (+) Transcript_77218:88-1440(+)
MEKGKVPLLATLTMKPEYGGSFVEKMREEWKKEGSKADRKRREYFVKRKEAAPQVQEERAPDDNEVLEEEDLLVELPAKLARFAAEEWYEIVSGLPLPQEAKNDNKNIGVAFDASSRLRRAGIDIYHWKLTDKLFGDKMNSVFYIHGKRKEALTLDQLPEKPKGHFRMVCISDTHLFHTKLALPTADFLVHAGDLCYEESRSENADIFDKYRDEKKPLCGEEFMKWFKASPLDLANSLAWLGTRMGYTHKVLIGGNHDYVLEQLGPANAKQLCKSYNVTYLYTTRPPLRLPLQSGQSVCFWGSGVSFVAGLGVGRAIKSGNNAFQIAQWEAAGFLEEQRERLAKEKPDVMVMHSGPKGMLLNKKGQDGEEDIIETLINEVKPKLFVCGHAHRPADPLMGLFHEFGHHTLGINAACTGVWNQRHGYPVVVDLPFSKSSPSSPLGFIAQMCG